MRTIDSELRYLVSLDQAEAFFAAAGVDLESEVHDPDRPIAYSRTLYLDTDDLAYLRSCARPVASRLRIRQYASAVNLEEAPRATSIAYLEYKENAGPARRKTRLAAPARRMAELLRCDVVDRVLRQEIFRLAELRGVDRDLRSGLLKPRLTTWYRRLSLAGEGIRVTLDEGLAYRLPAPPVEAGALAEPPAAFARGPSAVLEVKLGGSPPPWLAGATRALVPAAGFSKYQAGMAALMRNRRALGGLVTLPLPVLRGASEERNHAS